MTTSPIAWRGSRVFSRSAASYNDMAWVGEIPPSYADLPYFSRLGGLCHGSGDDTAFPRGP